MIKNNEIKRGEEILQSVWREEYGKKTFILNNKEARSLNKLRRRKEKKKNEK